MQEIDLKVTVVYRSGAKADKSTVREALCNLLLSIDREKLFSVCATEYAGYGVQLAEKVKLPPKKISKSDLALVSAHSPKMSTVTGNGGSSPPEGANLE